MEEYIKKLLEQVRFQKAHKAIGDEIRAHIEDQIEENISNGMDNETAEKRAVQDMGDPVEAGIELDKVHRPRIAWGVIISVVAVAIIGTVIQILLNNDPILMEQGQYYTPDGSSPYFIASSIMGICLMLALYFLDFTVIAKYSRIIAIIWAAFFIVTVLPNAVYGLFAKGDPFMLRILEDIEWKFANNMRLLVPLYAGILYKYKGQKGKTLPKALLWIIIPVFYAFVSYQYGRNDYVVIAICMLVELTIAISKGWIHVQKKAVLVPIWGAFILTRVISYVNSIKNYTYDVADETHKKVIDSIYLFGAGTYYGHGDFQKASSCFIYNPKGANILTYISTTWGAFWAIVVIAIVVGMIIIGFITVSKSKNQLGLIMGSGCMVWLAANAISNIISAFVVLPGCIEYFTFLPFVSDDYYNNIAYSYAALGILLSIYKYKDAYSQDVEIESVGVRNLLKDLNL